MTDSNSFSSDRKYRLLLRIAEKLPGTFELEALLDYLIDMVRTVVAYDAAGIFVVNQRALRLKRRATGDLIAGVALRGFVSRPTDNDPMLRAGRGVIGHVIRTGRSVIVPDVRSDPYYVQGRPSTLSEIAVPLSIGERVVGALNLESDSLNAFTAEDLELLQFFANAAAISIDRATLHNQLVEKNRIEGQLAIARQVQDSLLPDASPCLPGYDIAGINIPTWEIGGDYYDYFQLAGLGLGLVIADVSGKGVPAALIMATFRAALRIQSRQDFSLDRILHNINLFLLESTGNNIFVTAFIGILDPAAGVFTYANAGHNAPLILAPGGGMKALDHGGPVLGILKDAAFGTAAVNLAPGEILALFTDGVIEVASQSGAEFGEELLAAALRETAHRPAAEMVREVVDRARLFASTEDFPDDFTLVVLKRD